jgi:hypothetical protein
MLRMGAQHLPLDRIDVNQVNDQGQARKRGLDGEAGHPRAVRQDHVRPPFGYDPPQRGENRWRIEQRVSQGASRGKAERRRDPIRQSANRGQMNFLDQIAQCRDMSGFIFVVHQGDELDACVTPEHAQGMVRANPVASVRRVRQAVREKQNPQDWLKCLMVMLRRLLRMLAGRSRVE